MIFRGETFYYLNLLTSEIGTTKCIESDGTVHTFDIAPKWRASTGQPSIWIDGTPVYRIFNRMEMCEYVENKVEHAKEQLAKAEQMYKQFHSLDEETI